MGHVTEGLEPEHALGYWPVLKTREAFQGMVSIFAGPARDGFRLTHTSDTPLSTEQHVPISTQAGADPTVCTNFAQMGTG